MVKIKVGADLQPAQQEVDKFQKATGEAGKQAGEALAKGVEQGASKATKSLGEIEEAAKKTAKAAEKLALKEMVDKGVQAVGALKGVWDGMATSVLGVNEALAQSVSHTLDMTTKGAQLGAVFGPLGAAAGGVAGAFADIVGNVRQFNKEAPEAADKMHELLTGAKKGEDSFWSFGAAGQGARIALQKFSEAGEASKGKWYDFSVQGAGAKVVIDNIGEAALLNKDKVDEFNKAVEDAATNAALLASYEDSTYGPQRPTKPKAPTTPPKISAPKSEELSDIEKMKAGIQEVQDLNAHFSEAFAQDARDRVQAEKEAADAILDLQRRVAESNAQSEAERHQEKLEQLRKEAEESAKIWEETKRIAEEKAAKEAADLATKKQIYEDYAASIGAAFESAFVGVGANAAKTFFDQLEEGNVQLDKIGAGIKREAADFLKDTGSKLIGQGIFDLLKAASIGITSFGADPRAEALGILGGVEIGQALARGGLGVGLGRTVPQERAAGSASGGASSGASSGGGSSGGTATATELAPVNFWLAPGGTVVFPSDVRGQAQFGRFVNGAQRSAAKANAPKVNR